MAPRQRQTAQKAINVDELSVKKVAQTLRPEPERMAGVLKGLPVWIGLAIASGACAAINGVFAKLTTTSLTSSFAAHLATLLGLSADNKIVNVVLRGSFFGLNLLFNGIMWGLFTAALTKGSSTTRVSIINVSANFFITAVLGWMIFSEQLPLLWWLGAALLACGNVVIGRREEGEKPGGTTGLDQSQQEAVESEGLLMDFEDEPASQPRRRSQEERTRIERGEDADAPL